MTTTDEDKLMTVAQVAEFFQVTQYTVRKWLNGDPPTLRGIKLNGTQWRVRTSEVHRFADSQYGAK